MLRFLPILVVLLAPKPVAIAAEAVAAPPSEAGAAQPARDDYYTRRARSVLDAEKTAAAKPHPLAASYPGMDVVVCEAGCPRRAPEVVYARPQAAPPSNGGRMVPTSASEDDATVSAACIAGCYDETGGVPVPAAAPPQAAAAERPWSATVVPRDKLSPIR